MPSFVAGFFRAADQTAAVALDTEQALKHKILLDLKKNRKYNKVVTRQDHYDK